MWSTMALAVHGHLPPGPWDPLLELAVPLVIPVVVAALPVMAVNAKRWFTLGTGGRADLPGLLQLGREGPVLPGRVHARKNRLWWVAEGCDRPIRLKAPAAKTTDFLPAPVPREFTLGVMDAPTSIAVKLEGGQVALLFVREPSREAVRDILYKDKPDKGHPPNASGRRPPGRLSVLAFGALALSLGLGYAGLLYLGPRVPATVTASPFGDDCTYAACKQVVWTEPGGVGHVASAYPMGLEVGDSLDIIIEPITNEMVDLRVLGTCAVLASMIGVAGLGYGIGMLHRRAELVSAGLAHLSAVHAMLNCPLRCVNCRPAER